MSSRKSQRIARAPLARYTNYFEVGHNACEFLINFGQFQPESAEVALHTRIAVGPIHAKLLAEMLWDAVRQHEADNGPILELTESDRESRSAEVWRDAIASSGSATDWSSTSKR